MQKGLHAGVRVTIYHFLRERGTFGAFTLGISENTEKAQEIGDFVKN